MRSAKRWARAQFWEWRTRDRRREVAEELTRALALPARPRLVERGNLGHDSNYNVFSGGEQIGVLRLVNPHKRRPAPSDDQPFVIAGPSMRIKHEYEVYSRGFASGLTPEPVWMAPDALFCRYLPYRPLMSWVKSGSNLWPLLREGSAALDRLHREAGLSHMDASLGNVIASEDRSAHALVDFEYLPAEGVSFAEQRLYDHLRLVNSSWKFLRLADREPDEAWLEQLSDYLDAETRAAPLERIAPALGNLTGDAAWRAALGRLLRRTL
ncbi:MAG: hypothetical protein KA105_03060 [Caulobacter sp.]|nr:hypothetical protein [Caulobacter sp.]